MALSGGSRHVSRRTFLGGVGALTASALLGCSKSLFGNDNDQEPVVRLTSRPGSPTVSPTTGLTELGLGGNRDGILYVPESYSPDTPAPLFIGLHGAGGTGANWASYPDRAEERGMVFLAPDSRARTTWDLIADGRFKKDVEFLDMALAHVFERCRIDPTSIALGGFSDGASYALSLGVANGDLFTHLVAYSPGFIHAAGELIGSPPIFVSHGTQDPVLPFSSTRDSLLPTLENAGYDVTFLEFDGGHEVPAHVSKEALDWFQA